MKIRPVGAELFRADAETDMAKLIVTFRNFANAPKTRFTSNRKYHNQTLPLPIPTGNNRCLFAKCRISNNKARRIYSYQRVLRNSHFQKNVHGSMYRALAPCSSGLDTCDVLRREVVSHSPNCEPGRPCLHMYDRRWPKYSPSRWGSS
jgi:hypothetical protein